MELLLESLVNARPGRTIVVGLAGVAAIAAGCASHNDRAAGYLSALEAGRWNRAVDEAAAVARSGPERNAVIDALELGTVQSVAGDWRGSDESFGRAWELMRSQGEPGDPGFLDNLAAVAVNERAVDYVGRSTDRTMCATMRALDLLAIGNPIDARVELKRAQFAQEDAEARHQERIEEARRRLESEESSLSAVESSSAFESASAEAWGDLEERFSPYRGWTIPFTDWLTAVLLLVDGSGEGDRNRAIDLLRRVGGTIGPVPAIESDLALAEASGPRDAQVWVVMGSGLAPVREEVVFRLPAFIPEFPFIGVAFPTLRQSSAGVVPATVLAGEDSVALDVVCDMGSVISHEFDAELPLITGRAIGAALAKAAASLAANIAARNSGSDWALVGTLVATNLYGYSTTLADLRTWRTLPRAWSVARIPRPDDGTVELGGGIGGHRVPLPGDGDAMILIRAIRSGSPVAIHAFPLDASASDAVQDPETAGPAEGDPS
ncbi:MAG: hypothetical protein VX726_05005 [Planctomycetota bacterium]|nr:hypothetical protein [Planctomycetota bacterium]